MNEKYYAVYRGDEYINSGTADELGEKLKVKSDTIRFMATPTHHKRRGDDALKAYLIKEEEHD